ncbi:Hypothetical protein SRAE_2000436200 [Strongyloides ratti]|uniref:Proteinase inhibitor I25, cystatin domain-containing protein n=1 Tax=Strongyloides ratti TaxID=34506 RepID=A0A090MZX9_STRRB|nr:Hypothetical protein SRAE_2000436200 [Strongyloides ratti]CEF69715.1 Hypothetical protein SRAE_2000436200 [Strongyloides ratti]
MKLILFLVTIFVVTFFERSNSTKKSVTYYDKNINPNHAKHIARYCLSVYNKKSGFKHNFVKVKSVKGMKFKYGINATIIFYGKEEKGTKKTLLFIGDYYQPFKNGNFKNYLKKRCSMGLYYVSTTKKTKPTTTKVTKPITTTVTQPITTTVTQPITTTVTQPITTTVTQPTTTTVTQPTTTTVTQSDKTKTKIHKTTSKVHTTTTEIQTTTSKIHKTTTEIQTTTSKIHTTTTESQTTTSEVQTTTTKIQTTTTISQGKKLSDKAKYFLTFSNIMNLYSKAHLFTS